MPSFLDRDAGKFYILLELGSMDLTQVIKKKREHGCYSLWMRTLWYDMLLAVKVCLCVTHRAVPSVASHLVESVLSHTCFIHCLNRFHK